MQGKIETHRIVTCATCTEWDMWSTKYKTRRELPSSFRKTAFEAQLKFELWVKIQHRWVCPFCLLLSERRLCAPAGKNT